MTKSLGAQDTYLLIPILLLAVLASIAVIRGPSLVTLPDSAARSSWRRR